MAIQVFGIRHHGPGCARSLLRALEEFQPDVLVLEGPADGQDSIADAAKVGMNPPVAMLLYPPEEPKRGVYYPFTVFSPEWQAIQWCFKNNKPIRLMDLPQYHRIALDKMEEEKLLAALKEQEKEQTEEKEEAEETIGDEAKDVTATERTWRTDPIALLAEAAGFQDHELWWEEQIERRLDAKELFTAILVAMRTVREELPEKNEADLLRESFMRKTIRGVTKEGFDRIAVVCGAWHAPVLDEEAIAGKRDGCKSKEDTDRLQGLPKIKTAATWIPWTNSRLSYRSGYGAGVHSPGWYHMLWTSDQHAATNWLATAARLLRQKDLDASSASIIEARRLADALAAMRGLRAPGLNELNESILSILCHGEPLPMQLIRNKLEIGEVLGEVPPDTPAVPIAQDLAAMQKSLRMKVSAESKPLDLDLRNQNDLQRSQLLHRLQLLGIPWGDLRRSGGGTSTFHEIWQMEWKPEFAVAIIEASVWGNTVEAASIGKVLAKVQNAKDLNEITPLLDACTVAGLTGAIEPLLQRIQTIAAVSVDVRHLMDALPPLAQVMRYGNVRGTQSQQIEPILVGMFERVVVGLSAACAALDDDAANRMLDSMTRVSEAIGVLQRQDLNQDWVNALERLIHLGVHALLRGWCCRFLLEQNLLTDEELFRRANLALSPANPPTECANWATGFLRGSGLLLLHQDAIWHVFDRWLISLNAEIFTEMLPLLRRAFSDFTGPERRQMGEKIKHLKADGVSATVAKPTADSSTEFASERAKQVLPILAHILGSKPAI